MLLSISLQDHQYEPIFGLNVDNSDQTIRDYLTFRLPPDRESIDLKSYYLTDYILRKIDDRRKEYEEYEKEYKKWAAQYENLSDEQKELFKKDQYIDGVIGPAPRAPELYDGVIIEDVPVYMVSNLIDYLNRHNVRIYFNYEYESMVFSEFKETDTVGVYDVVDKPSGNKEHKIFLYSTHILDIDEVRESVKDVSIPTANK
jgi:hypothetical protein|nr:MAG TPA: hypothetical protein [Bacteriophage sp.]